MNNLNRIVVHITIPDQYYIDKKFNFSTVYDMLAELISATNIEPLLYLQKNFIDINCFESKNVQTMSVVITIFYYLDYESFTYYNLVYDGYTPTIVL